MPKEVPPFTKKELEEHKKDIAKGIQQWVTPRPREYAGKKWKSVQVRGA